MKFLSIGLINLPLSPQDAEALGLAGESAEGHRVGLEIQMRRAGWEHAQVGEAGLAWMQPGHYLYIVTFGAENAIKAHAYLEKLGKKLKDGSIIPCTYAVRPGEKRLTAPPGRDDLLTLSAR